ncbi:MAG: FG-GAP-like repeat-containing protein [Anaerolineae bacterium]|nr:FG-GAP-like repeat-containing protein [Anaerolineae bacterium]
MKARLLALLLLLALLGLSPWPVTRAATPLAVQAPVLKWQHGGCYSSWCETGWYSSPAVADLDGDGTMEVIGAAYTLFVLNGEDGEEQWHMAPPVSGARVWPGVVVADVDGNGDLELVIAQGSGYISVYDHTGNFEPGWPQRPATNEFRSLAVADLDDDGDMEIVAGLARLNPINVWVFEHTGNIRPGWPQLSTDQGSAAGLYNDNIGLGDLDGDGVLELVIPSDTITLCAYEPDGSQLATHEMYHGHSGHDMDYWGEVPAYVDLEYETRGWGPCYTESTARANFANGPANIVDVNGDGVVEVVAIGDVHDCHTNPYTDLYNGPYIFNADRSRFNAGGFDWTTLPTDTGAPVIQDYNVIESVQPNPVTVDLDGDGNLEILYPSYDGRMHAFWLDKTEHHNWPYAVYTGGNYRFASEPVVADLDNDGHPEVIFASWVQKGTYQTGKLHILDYQGNSLQEVDLPAAYGSPNWNGVLAAPTLANIDSDPDLEVVLNTAHSGFVAYDLPGTAEARILWGTGRGNYQRTGSLLYGSLQGSTKSVSPTLPGPGDVLTYTITLHNPGPGLPGVRVTDTLPSEVHYLGDLWASSGSYGEAGGIITWTGEAPAAAPVTITFGVTVSAQLTTPYTIVNTVLLDDGLGNVLERQATVIANGYAVYLPVIQRH